MREMQRHLPWCVLAIIGLIVVSAPARADLYQAAMAVEKGDVTKAFLMYRELAELGHPLAQENIAAMYVNGEGVPRDNVLGYAWAKLALENGGGDVASSIVRQLEPHLNEPARARIAEIHARHGIEELQRRLLPRELAPAPHATQGTACELRTAPDPDRFFPDEARRKGIAGTVVIEARVRADGSAPIPRVVYSFPPGAFEAPGRAVALGSTFKPPMENGVAVPCTIRFRVKFNVPGAPEQFTGAEALRVLEELKPKAVSGDPRSQLLYSLIMMVRPATDPDRATTSSWLVRAAQAGLPAAQYLVGERLLSFYAGWEHDEAKAAQWLEMAASRGSGEASTTLAIFLLRADHDPATRERGMTWMQRAAESGHFEGRLFYAALLASWPDASRRDPARALALLAELDREFDYDPLSFEIRAAALAATGDFEGAVNQQKRAIGKARRMGWKAGAQESRLRMYEQGRMLEQELIRF